MRRFTAVFLLSIAMSACRCGPQVNKIAPSLNVSPTGISFDKVKVDDAATFIVNFESKTNTAVTVSSVKLEAGTAPGGVEGFTLKNTPTQIEALGKTQMQIVFTPKAVQAYSVTLVISSDDPEKPQVRIPVIGEGAQPLVAVTPECSLNRQCNGTAVVSPPSLDFGQEPLTRPSPIEVTKLPSINIVNAGAVSLTVTVHGVTGADASAFSIAGNAIAPETLTILEPGDGLNVPIRFVPTSFSKTDYAAELKIDTDDPTQLVVTVALKGKLKPNVAPVVCANLVRVTPPPAVDAPRDYSQRAVWDTLLIAPATGYDFRKNRDVRPGDLVQLSALSDAANASVCTTDAEDGRTGLTYEWKLSAFPIGAMGLAISGATSAQAQLRPVVTGDYTLDLKVTDTAGGVTSVSMQFSVAVKQDLVAQLQWQGFSDVDLDLHLIRPGPPDSGVSAAFGFFDEGLNAKTSSDINGFSESTRAQSTNGLNFDWGDPGDTDNPKLNVDDKGQGDLTENISLNSPENAAACATSSCVYRVMVHYFHDQRVSTAPACTVTGLAGCRDGETCGCTMGKTCVADSLPRADAGVGPGKCYLPPKPVVRLFFRGSPVAAAVIPLDTLSPANEVAIGAPCQLLHVADISWPAKNLIGSLPDGGTPPPTVQIIGADNTGRIINPQFTRYGYRQTGGSLRCSPDTTVSGVDWYSQQP